MSDIGTAPLPASFAGMRVYNGIPVPVTVNWVDDVPDFRAIDTPALAACLQNRLCSVCGSPMGYWITFVGGPQSVSNRVFLDGPMHDECARWSMRYCPFLSGKITTMSDPEKRPSKAAEGQVISVDPIVDPERPEKMALYVTRTYEVIATRERLMIRAGKPKRLEWVA